MFMYARIYERSKNICVYKNDDTWTKNICVHDIQQCINGAMNGYVYEHIGMKNIRTVGGVKKMKKQK